MGFRRTSSMRRMDVVGIVPVFFLGWGKGEKTFLCVPVVGIVRVYWESTGFPEVASAALLQRSIWLVRSDGVIITVE